MHVYFIELAVHCSLVDDLSGDSFGYMKYLKQALFDIKKWNFGTPLGKIMENKSFKLQEYNFNIKAMIIKGNVKPSPALEYGLLYSL